jgi:UDP-N-acetylglucosamine acyltransferase
MWSFIDGNKIHSTAIICDNVVIGTGNIIYPYAVIGLPGFTSSGPDDVCGVVIGDDNWIGAHVSIMSGAESDTAIGSGNFIMNYSNIGHDVLIGDKNEIGVRAILAGFCKIGSLNKIKINCCIRNRAVLGSKNIIGMGSVVTSSFYENEVLIYGSPAKIIRKLDRQTAEGGA